MKNENSTINWKEYLENFYLFDILEEISLEEFRGFLFSLGFNELDFFHSFDISSIKKGSGIILRMNKRVYLYFYTIEVSLYYCSEKSQTLVNLNRMEDYGYQDDEISFHFYDTLLAREKYIARVESLVKDFLSLKTYFPSFPVNFGGLEYNTHLISANMQTIISDEEISLVLSKYKDPFDINVSLKIKNNQTHEDMGYIEFELGDTNFDYDGNVHYLIRKPFRGNGYATKALSLVKEFVFASPKECDKDLYVSVLPENEASSKVALHNGGVLVFDGFVPAKSLLYQKHRIEKVRIYKITNC